MQAGNTTQNESYTVWTSTDGCTSTLTMVIISGAIHTPTAPEDFVTMMQTPAMMVNRQPEVELERLPRSYKLQPPAIMQPRTFKLERRRRMIPRGEPG